MIEELKKLMNKKMAIAMWDLLFEEINRLQAWSVKQDDKLKGNSRKKGKKKKEEGDKEKN